MPAKGKGGHGKWTKAAKPKVVLLSLSSDDDHDDLDEHNEHDDATPAYHFYTNYTTWLTEQVVLGPPDFVI